MVDEPLRYMVLYNQRTGMLKVFYYQTNNLFANNNGAWEVSFNQEKEWMNHLGEISIPQNVSRIKNWGCSNAVSSNTKSISVGWNGFQMQLAYCPNVTSELKMEILSHCMNTTNVNLFGDSYNYSNGTILTHSSNNPLSGLTSNLSSMFGKVAEEYIEDSIFKKTDTRGLISSIAGGLIKYGVNKIFSKLTASFNRQTTSTKDIEFTTKGNLTVNGSLTFNSNSPAKSVRANFNKDYVGEVGTWNITEQPIIYLDPRADYIPDPQDATFKEYTYKLRGISKFDYNLIINPELVPHIKSQWVNIDLVRYWNHEVNAPQIPTFYTFGNLGRKYNGFGGNSFTTSDLIYGEYLKDGSIYDEKMDNYTLYSTMAIYGKYGGPIPTVYVPEVECHENKCFNSENIFLKMNLYLVTEFEGKIDTTLSTRTFIPKIEWDPRLCEALKNIPMNQLQRFNHIK